MSNPFTNFLGGVIGGIFDGGPNLKDYQHADRLYVRNTYARAPKVGFLYFVNFNINANVIKDSNWAQKNKNQVGLLVKKIDLPKFKITTETLNQYNRKTVVQTKLTYDNVSLDLHDDNSDITNKLWENYYKYYYTDSNYGNTDRTKLTEFGDTKYGTEDYSYGLKNKQNLPFFESIDIYVMHQQKFTQMTLINPMITDWSHDSLNQDEGGKILSSKMQIAYEDVLYKYGTIRETSPQGYRAFYDTKPSPLSIGGKGTNTLFGPGGVIAGAGSVFDLLNKEDKSPLDYLNLAIQAKTTAQNARQLSKGGLKQEGYSILKGVLGEVQATGNQPGGVKAAVQTGLNQSGIGIAAQIGVNIFSGKNASVNNTTKASPSKLTGGG
jgi:hypothetical protein